MTYESLLNNKININTKYSSQNNLGEWSYAYSSASSSTKCRITPLTASERIDNSGLFDNVKYKCYCLSSASINRGDQIAYRNEKYRVREVLIDSSYHHKTALLELIT